MNGSISTHTLTWSVTYCVSQKVFIHEFQLTRSRGAWLLIYLSSFPRLYFNSHAHVERDALHSQNMKSSPYISTHTLTWSVTISSAEYTPCFRISTHTLTWSVTRYAIGKIKEYIISTHTLTWSVTQNLLPHINNVFISTHTLTWSVTSGVSQRTFCIAISTHTLTWSVTLTATLAWYATLIHFNSHAHVERD